jgi:hypothetical protein
MSAKKPEPNGRQKSTNGGKPSRKNKSRKKPLTREQLLARTFEVYQDKEDARAYAERKADFIFHMTDWDSDLQTLAKLYQHPDQFDRKEACRFIYGFLAHVIPHLNAAGRLLLDEIPDPFSDSARVS